jgi:hypothetical protein
MGLFPTLNQIQKSLFTHLLDSFLPLRRRASSAGSLLRLDLTRPNRIKKRDHPSLRRLS